jgi:hypothetical protein
MAGGSSTGRPALYPASVVETSHASQQHRGCRRSRFRSFPKQRSGAIRTSRDSAVSSAAAKSERVSAGRRSSALQRNHRQRSFERSACQIERRDLSAGRRRSRHCRTSGERRPHAGDSVAGNTRWRSRYSASLGFDVQGALAEATVRLPLPPHWPIGFRPGRAERRLRFRFEMSRRSCDHAARSSR